MSVRLFEDIFDVKDKDPDGKKFDRVSRVICLSENYEMELTLDVNTQLYPVEKDDRFTFMLARSLYEDGTMDDEVKPTYDQSRRPSLADQFEYVMHGKVYRVDEDGEAANKLAVFISFGGLLMRLRGDARNLTGIAIDTFLYLLLRKV
eukprot:m.256102 g.256102  ORF g.256102 m.256102 type:complete len:148 (+) comp19168_c0_seq7:2497-2940(+)